MSNLVSQNFQDTIMSFLYRSRADPQFDRTCLKQIIYLSSITFEYIVHSLVKLKLKIKRSQTGIKSNGNPQTEKKIESSASVNK